MRMLVIPRLLIPWACLQGGIQLAQREKETKQTNKITPLCLRLLNQNSPIYSTKSIMQSIMDLA